jgi:O-antigen/teichoic acid export membrane protein
MTPPTAPHPSRRRATTWNLAFAYGSVALALVRNLALVPIFLHFIEAREYGAWLATGGVLAYLLMLDFGLMGVLQQRAAEAYGSSDLVLLARRVGTGLAVTLLLALLSALLTAAVSPWVPGMMRLSGEAADRLAICFLIVGLANSVNLLALGARAVLRGLQRPLIPGLATLGSEVAGIALTLLLLWDGRGLYAVALGLGLRGLLNAVVNTVGCAWACRSLLGLRLSWSMEEARSFWRSSVYVFFAAIAVRLQGRSDAFFVGWILGPEAALVYGLTIRAHETVRLVTVHVVGAVQPSLAHLHGSGNAERVRQVVVTMLHLLAALSGLGMCGVVVFNGAFMRLWVGEPLYGGLLLTALVACFGYVADLGSAQYGTLLALGRFRSLCRLVWTGTLVRLPLLVILLGAVGLWGAAAAAIVGAALQTALSSQMAARLLALGRKQSLRIAAGVARSTLPLVGLTLLALALGLDPQSWLALGLGAAAFAGLASLVLTAASPSLVRELVTELRQMRGAGA